MSAITHVTRPRSQNLRFALHYGEMVLAMLIGMGLLAVAQSPFFSFGALLDDAPALALGVMGANMTVPMVAWMRFRGHGWAPSAEMAGAMIGPTILTVALLAAGVVTGPHDLMGIQHVLMFPAMLGVMLLRRDEYSH